jgi:general secretion pathway protein L
MAFDAADFRLFGLDPGRAADTFRQGWEGALRWPMFAWLSPAQRVAARWPDGTSRVCMGASLTPAPEGRHPRFHALVLPSDIVLTHSLKLPHLLEAEIEQALELELQTISPFPANQLEWGWRIDEVTEHGIQTTLAFASKAHVSDYLDRHQSRIQSGSPMEVWAEADGIVVLKGFGEHRRKTRMRAQRRQLVFTLIATVLLVAAFASAPIWQIRARAIDAQNQFAQLQSDAFLYVESRNALTLANEKAMAIGSYLDGQANAPQVLDTLTELLPDSAWISRLDIDGRRVRLTGQAADAAGLMELLRARAEFSDLRALSPITRGRDGRDTFSFELMVMPRLEGQ